MNNKTSIYVVLFSVCQLQFAMEDSIEVILQDHDRVFSPQTPHPVVSACLGALLTGLYGVWSLFALPGFRKIPWKLKVTEISFV